jgi:hypothetical protein
MALRLGAEMDPIPPGGSWRWVSATTSRTGPGSCPPSPRSTRDMAVNIEHEDASYTRLDGLALAAGNLRAAAAKM